MTSGFVRANDTVQGHLCLATNDQTCGLAEACNIFFFFFFFFFTPTHLLRHVLMTTDYNGCLGDFVADRFEPTLPRAHPKPQPKVSRKSKLCSPPPLISLPNTDLNKLGGRPCRQVCGSNVPSIDTQSCAPSMIALQDGQTQNAFSGSSKSRKNRKGLAVLPPEEVKLFSGYIASSGVPLHANLSAACFCTLSRPLLSNRRHVSRPLLKLLVNWLPESKTAGM